MSGAPTPSANFIRADFHNHTHYSPDSILSPRAFVREARRRGLTTAAITDHNTIRGALVARELADFPVIIGEEVKTTDGEILGLFLSEDVPRDLPASETIARIKHQGGIVGVPHPFDSLRSALLEDVMLGLIDQIDFIEALMVFHRPGPGLAQAPRSRSKRDRLWPPRRSHRRSLLQSRTG